MWFSEVTVKALKYLFPSKGAYLEGGNMFSMWLDLSPLTSATQALHPLLFVISQSNAVTSVGGLCLT